MAMLHSERDDRQLADDLLRQGEAWLTNAGDKRILGGGRPPFSQFYLGLYGGSELPGVLTSDTWMTELLLRGGYQMIEELAVMHRDLVSFRPPVSRNVRRLRREVEMQQDAHLELGTWWEAHKHIDQELVRFELTPFGSQEALAHVSCWDIEPLATTWGVPTVGMVDLATAETHRRRGLATYLLAEAFRVLRVRGVSMVESHIRSDHTAALALCHKLGFTQIDAGRLYEKTHSAQPSD